MSMYRLTVITKDNSSLPNVKEVIAQTEATMIQEVSHGERAFAYPVQKLTRGLYSSFVIEGEPQKIHHLDEQARSVDGVLRTLLSHWSLPKQPKAKVAKKETAAEMATETAKEKGREVKAAPTKTKKIIKTKVKKKVLASDTERLKELDEKLAEILKS